MPPQFHRMGATEVLKLLKDDKITVATYARDLLDRIDNRESVVKAWTYLGELSTTASRQHKLTLTDADFILSQANALDQIPKDERGPLHGLAVGVKDVMNTRGTQKNCKYGWVD